MRNFIFIKKIDPWDSDHLESVFQDFISEYEDLNLGNFANRYFYCTGTKDSNEALEKLKKDYCFEISISHLYNVVHICSIDSTANIESLSRRMKIELNDVCYINEYAKVFSRTTMILFLALFLPNYAKSYFYDKIKLETGYDLVNNLDKYSEDLDKSIFDGMFKQFFTKNNYKKLIDMCLIDGTNEQISILNNGGEK